VHFFPISRRLDPRAVPVARAFYPREYDFDAAVLPDTRRLRLLPAVGGDWRLRLLDRALDLAAADGLGQRRAPGRRHPDGRPGDGERPNGS